MYSPGSDSLAVSNPYAIRTPSSDCYSIDTKIQAARIKDAKRAIATCNLAVYRSNFQPVFKNAILFHQACLTDCLDRQDCMYDRFDDKYSKMQSERHWDNVARMEKALEEAEVGLVKAVELASAFKPGRFEDSILKAYTVYQNAAHQLLKDHMNCSRRQRMIALQGLTKAIEVLDRELGGKALEDTRSPGQKSADRLDYMYKPLESLVAFFTAFETSDVRLKKDFVQLFAWTAIVILVLQKLFAKKGTGHPWGVNLSVRYTDIVHNVRCRTSDGPTQSRRLENLIDEVMPQDLDWKNPKHGWI